MAGARKRTHELTNRHVLMVGGSGTGKTTQEIANLLAIANNKDSAIVVLDPHVNSLAYKFMSYCVACGHHDRIIYDRLTDLDRVLTWDFLSPSRERNENKRRNQNSTRISQFTEVLLRSRGKASAADTPTISEWIKAALRLYLYQRKRRPLADIRYSFSFDHPTFQEMLEGCTDEDTRYKFESTIDNRRGGYEATERLINELCESSAFLLRTQKPSRFDLTRHLDNKGILIVEGGSGDDISTEALEAMLGAISQRVIGYCRARYARTKQEKPHVTMAMDEATNYNMIGAAKTETKALAECRKMGLGMHILIQSFNFPNEQIRKDVVQNCASIFCFRCDDYDTRAKLAQQLGKSEEHDYQNELAGLGVGEYIVRWGTKKRGTIIEHKQGRAMPEPFGFPVLTKQRTEQALRLIQQRPEYYSPMDDLFNPPEDDDTPAPGNSKDSPPDKPTSDDNPFGIM